MTRIALVDYGAGNLLSIGQALTTLGGDVRVARRRDDLRDADLVVVPGVGAAGPAIGRLRRAGLAAGLGDAVAGGAWCLGICLGMQLLFERSDEDGARALGWIAGVVRAIPGAPRLPHIGWNGVVPVGVHPLFDGVAPGAPMYFVHSYVAAPEDRSVVLAETEHGGRFASAVAQGRLIGLQFHPEKSGRDGLRVLQNVLGLVNAGAGTGAVRRAPRGAGHRLPGAAA